MTSLKENNVQYSARTENSTSDNKQSLPQCQINPVQNDTPVSLPHLMAILIGLLFLSVLLYIFHSVFQYARLRHFKGPRTVGFSNIWLLRCVTSGMMHSRFLEVNHKYGVYRLCFFQSKSRTESMAQK